MQTHATRHPDSPLSDEPPDTGFGESQTANDVKTAVSRNEQSRPVAKGHAPVEKETWRGCVVLCGCMMLSAGDTDRPGGMRRCPHLGGILDKTMADHVSSGLVGGFAGLGGAVNVIFARELIARFNGSRKTLGVLSGLQAGIGLLALLLIKEQRRAPMRVDWRRFRLVSVANDDGTCGSDNVRRPPPPPRDMEKRVEQEVMLEKGVAAMTDPALIGFLPPFAYITTYTQETIVPTLNPSSVTRLTSAWPLCTMGFGMLIGRAFVGMIADKIGAIQTFIIAMEIAGLLQMIVWHFATNFAGVIVFSLVYGAFGGSGLSLIPVVTGQLFGVGPNFATLVGLGMLASAPGQLVGPTISGAILDAADHQWIGFQIFSGAMMCFGGLIGVYSWWKGIGLTFGKGVRKLAVLPESSVGQA
ncbi:hypothetical protein QFC19_008854 [Naganishia cerealis]|uniref:Uncharacterized protein n=1 Tax=Naganishia cerealis TaxID=610337 RepID=A0ACC2UYC7_9TREE|nr:hypothetical protein QFC19_008854 [Naganishia cerealis]